MAKSSKGARHIVVEDVKYRWRATGNDGYISLAVWPEELPGSTITSTFSYDQTLIPQGDGSASATRQIVITSRIVRRVIEYAARAHGYDARANARQLDLRDMGDKIDLSDALRSA